LCHVPGKAPRLAVSATLDLAEDDLLTDPLEADLYLFRDRLNVAIEDSEDQHGATP
jgi:hypothetical protein